MCLKVCPRAYLLNCIKSPPNFCACCPGRGFLVLSDGVAIRCVFPALWMTLTSHFPIMGNMETSFHANIQFTAGQHRCEVRCSIWDIVIWLAKSISIQIGPECATLQLKSSSTAVPDCAYPFVIHAASVRLSVGENTETTPPWRTRLRLTGSPAAE